VLISSSQQQSAMSTIFGAWRNTPLQGGPPPAVHSTTRIRHETASRRAPRRG